MFCQKPLRLLDADVLQELLGTRSGPVGEELLEMRRTQTNFSRSVFQTGLVSEVLLEISDRMTDSIEIQLILVGHTKDNPIIRGMIGSVHPIRVMAFLRQLLIEVLDDHFLIDSIPIDLEFLRIWSVLDVGNQI